MNINKNFIDNELIQFMMRGGFLYNLVTGKEVNQMRRIATCLILCAFSVLNVGCKSNGAGGLFGSRSHEATTPPDPYLASTEAAAYEPTGFPAYNQPAPVDNTYAPPQEVEEIPVAANPTTSRYYTVAKRDTLYAIARSYYGDQRRWKEIYEANRADISDPNRIRVGQRLLIP